MLRHDFHQRTESFAIDHRALGICHEESPVSRNSAGGQINYFDRLNPHSLDGGKGDPGNPGGHARILRPQDSASLEGGKRGGSDPALTGHRLKLEAL